MEHVLLKMKFRCVNTAMVTTQPRTPSACSMHRFPGSQVPNLLNIGFALLNPFSL